MFAKAGVESQLDAMFSNQVTLKSGGYIVINQTEALVAIDVNSGRSTREHNIEDTALRTNLEAADEIARQLRLRDLAGLIVVDFIDMEESRNNRAVERRTKDALKNDRARIQVGRISHFGLLEMSRQRIRTGVLEGSTVVCAHCQGAGVVRSTSSIALHVLRVLEDALIKSATHDIVVRTRTAVALYILNQKRANLRDLERRFGVAISVEADDTLTGANYHAIERGEPATGPRHDIEPAPLAQDDFATIVDEPAPIEDEIETRVDDEGEEPEDEAPAREGPGSRGKPGGRSAAMTAKAAGGGGGGGGGAANDRGFGESIAPDAPQPTDDGLAVVAEIGGDLQAEVPRRSLRGPRVRRRGRARRTALAPLAQRTQPLPAACERARICRRGGAEPGLLGVLEPARRTRPRRPESRRQSSPSTRPVSPFPSTGRLDRRRLSEQPAAPSTQPSVEETAGSESRPGETEPAKVAERDRDGRGRIRAASGRRAAGPRRGERRGRYASRFHVGRTRRRNSRPRRTGWWQRARASIVGD